MTRRRSPLKKGHLWQRKSQAVEYLITYGWAIVMILLVLSLIFYTGVFDPSVYLPSTCTLDGVIGCLDHKITDNYVELAVINKAGEDIAISSITVPDCNGTASGTLRKGEKGTFRITNCNITNNTRYNGGFSVDYTAKSGLEHNIRGAIDTRVQVSVANARIVAFRENAASINETNDAQISADSPNTKYGASNVLTIDEQGPHSHAVIQFPNIIGNAVGQIPPSAQINSATLKVNCFNAGYTGKAYLLLEPWVESQATWNNRTSTSTWGNAGADGAVSRGANLANWTCPWPTGYKDFDMTAFVRSWATGTLNYGIVVINTGTDGFDFYTSEDATAANRPLLTVNFTVFE